MDNRLWMIFLMIFVLSFVASCSSSAIEETSKAPELSFCPKENCTQKLVEFLSPAQRTIHCAFFDLDLPEIISLLAEKSTAIEVKVVVDKDNMQSLKGPGIRPDTKSSYMHNKFCIVDEEKVYTGSFNPTFNDAYWNNNNMLIVYSHHIARLYEDEFQELWQGQFGTGNITKEPEFLLNKKPIAAYFCPEDRCSEKIIAQLQEAKESIYFMLFSFTHERIAQMLVIKSQEGLDIQGIFDKTQNSRYSQYTFLAYQGIPVSLDHNPKFMHHKVFIIDNVTVITGSFNPSNNADHDNDENVIILKDKELAQRYIKEFFSLQLDEDNKKQ